MTKSGWKPKGHEPSVLSRVEKEFFSDEMNDFTQSNLSGEEWKALRNLADERSIVIKAADKVLQYGIEMTAYGKLLDNYGIPIYTRMLNLTKIFSLV